MSFGAEDTDAKARTAVRDGKIRPAVLREAIPVVGGQNRGDNFRGIFGDESRVIHGGHFPGKTQNGRLSNLEVQIGGSVFDDGV